MSVIAIPSEEVDKAGVEAGGNGDPHTRIICSIVEKMKIHINVSEVQEYGCGALLQLALNNDSKKILNVGGIEAIIDSMKRHIDVACVQSTGCGALWTLC